MPGLMVAAFAFLGAALILSFTIGGTFKGTPDDPDTKGYSKNAEEQHDRIEYLKEDDAESGTNPFWKQIASHAKVSIKATDYLEKLYQQSTTPPSYVYSITTSGKRCVGPADCDNSCSAEYVRHSTK